MAKRRSKGGKRHKSPFARAADQALKGMRKRVLRCIKRCAGIGRRRKRK